MPAVDSWLAGVFDASGLVYVREGGLAVRVYFPKRFMANQVRLALGGKVGGLKPAYWTIREGGDLDRFIIRIGPFIRGQREALRALTAFREKEIDTFKAGHILSDHYENYQVEGNDV
jgi:hypothetical protein